MLLEPSLLHNQDRELHHTQHGHLVVRNTTILLKYTYSPDGRLYKSLPPQPRIMLGVTVMAIGAFGMYMDNAKDENEPPTALQKELEQLKKYVPKITIVDRQDKGK